MGERNGKKGEGNNSEVRLLKVIAGGVGRGKGKRREYNKGTMKAHCGGRGVGAG